MMSLCGAFLVLCQNFCTVMLVVEHLVKTAKKRTKSMLTYTIVSHEDESISVC